MFQRHAALLVTNNALCLMSGLTSDIEGDAVVTRNMQQEICIAVNIALRTLNSLHYAQSTLFQGHAALLVANNAVCLTSGFDFVV